MGRKNNWKMWWNAENWWNAPKRESFFFSMESRNWQRRKIMQQAAKWNFYSLKFFSPLPQWLPNRAIPEENEQEKAGENRKCSCFLQLCTHKCKKWIECKVLLTRAFIDFFPIEKNPPSVPGSPHKAPDPTNNVENLRGIGFLVWITGKKSVKMNFRRRKNTLCNLLVFCSEIFPKFSANFTAPQTSFHNTAPFHCRSTW